MEHRMRPKLGIKEITSYILDINPTIPMKIEE
jgi:hypothetical protein